MSIKIFEKQWDGGAILVELSNYWTHKGKPVWFRIRRIPQSPPHISAWTLILGPVHLGVGWLNKKVLSQRDGYPNQN